MSRVAWSRAGVAVACGVLVVLGCSASAGLAGADYPAVAFGPEGMPLERGALLAPPATLTGEPVDGVACSPPVTTFHIHTHLAVYVAGALRPVPGAIGMVGPVARERVSGQFFYAHVCYYSLHTHAQDGVIHVEGAAPRTYTLGQFFALWRQRLDGHRVGPAHGDVTAYVDGRPVGGDPADVVLTDRSSIQLDVGKVVAPRPVDWDHF